MNSADLEARLRRQEDRNFDFKAAGPFEGKFRADLTADIAAMANTPGGGTIVVGVRKVDGVWTAEGVTAENLKSFDKTPVAQAVRNFLDPVPRFDIETLETGGKLVIAISVVEFEDVPIVVKKTIQHDGGLIAREGDVLIRTDAAQTRTIQSADEMRQLLGRALSRNSENLLADIRSVVLGVGPKQLEKTPKELFDEQLPSWRDVIASFDAKYVAYARWEVKILPQPLAAPLDPKLLPDLLRKTQVSLRGWNFPHIDSRTGPLFEAGFVATETEWQEFREVAHLGERGAFGFTRVVSSELKGRGPGFNYPEPPERILDAIGVLWSVTEFFRFALNLAEAMGSESLWLSIHLKGIRGRSLGSFNPARMWWGDHQSRAADVPLASVFTVAELKSAWKEKAREWARRFFVVFQWADADDSMLSKDQDQLTARGSA